MYQLLSHFHFTLHLTYFSLLSVMLELGLCKPYFPENFACQFARIAGFSKKLDIRRRREKLSSCWLVIPVRKAPMRAFCSRLHLLCILLLCLPRGTWSSHVSSSELPGSDNLNSPLCFPGIRGDSYTYYYYWLCHTSCKILIP